MASSTQEQVSITVPAEHTAAVRDSFVEDIGDLADSIQGKVAKMETLSRALVNSRGDGEPLCLEAESKGERYRLRVWAKRAQNDAAETLKDLELYADPTWWEYRSRSLIAVSAQVLEAVGPEPAPLEDDEAVMVRLSREQRDAILEQLDNEVSRAIGADPGIGDLAAYRQIIEDALELEADLEGERGSYPLTTRRVSGIEADGGWDDTRRSVRLERLTRRMVSRLEEDVAKFPPGSVPPFLRGPLHPEETEEDRAEGIAQYRRESQAEHDEDRKSVV